jgi:acetyltransferase-like isoleucine patch superfamily enzyme
MTYVAEKAWVDADASIGHNVVIEPGAEIGAGCSIGNHVTICSRARLGSNVTVLDFSIVGREPALADSSTASRQEPRSLIVGDGTVIGSHAVVLAGSTIGSRCTIEDGAGVRERCSVGDDTLIGRNVTVENDVTIGERVRIQTAAHITGYSTVEDDVYIAPLVMTMNDNDAGRGSERFSHRRGPTIRRAARVGGGAHILPGREIGEDAFVAAGSVVTHDVPARTLVMGVPARVVRPIPDEEAFEAEGEQMRIEPIVEEEPAAVPGMYW